MASYKFLSCGYVQFPSNKGLCAAAIVTETVETDDTFITVEGRDGITNEMNLNSVTAWQHGIVYACGIRVV